MSEYTRIWFKGGNLLVWTDPRVEITEKGAALRLTWTLQRTTDYLGVSVQKEVSRGTGTQAEFNAALREALRGTKHRHM